MVKKLRFFFFFEKFAHCQVGKNVFDINKDVKNLLRLEKIKTIVKMTYLGIL